MADVLDRFDGEQRSCFKITNCGAVRGAESFLIRADGANILVDTGYGFCAGKMTENVRRELAGESLDFVLLTHSHYDHALGSARCKRDFPQAKIIAGAYCAEVFNREGARRGMAKMDAAAARAYGWQQTEDLTGELSVDAAVNDGDELQLGSETVRVIALPGHTKCCVGYYFVNKRFLVSCETIGIYAGEEGAIPGCLVGYRMTLDSIERALALNPQEMLLSHSGMLYGDSIASFLNSARKSTIEAHDLIVDAYGKGLDTEQLIGLFKQHYYSDAISKFYPLSAFMANASAQIPMFIREA